MGEDRIDSEISPVKLVVIERTGEPKQFKLTNTTTFTTGSTTEQEGDTIVMDYPFLDQVLGRIEYRLTKWVYHDLSDETETYVNGENVATNYEHELTDGDVIKVTSDQLTLVCVFRDHYTEDVQWERIDLKGVGNAINLYGKGAIAEGNNGVTYDDDKHHVVMKYNDRRWEVQDVNTTRGVYINRQKIEPNRPTPLNLYDVIVIGDTIFVYQQDQLIFNAKEAQKKDSGLAIHIEERTVWNTFKKKTLLKDIHLQIEPGNMVLILGGSGAGKTTFINAVTGYEKAKAQITEGDKNVYRDYDQMKYEIGFVPQQDLLRGDDDVRMTLMNSAETRMPEDTPVEVLEERVDAILGMFGLDTVQNDLVEKLSGGQRKRLSIAVEFMADPKLFILDEPDSGLDGVMARDLMTRLRKIADQGRIVMVITHTPDRVIDLFDKVIVLAKDRSGTGRLCYYGPIEEAKTFFGKDSMEEIVLTINREDEGGEGRADEFVDKFRVVNHEDDAYDKEPLQTFEEIEQREAAIKLEKAAASGAVVPDEPSLENTGAEASIPLPQDDSLESRALRDWDDEAKARDELAKIPVRTDNADQLTAQIREGKRHSSRFNQVRVYLGKFFRIFIYEKDWKVIPMAAMIAWVVAFVVGGSLFRTMEGTTLGALAIACVCIWNGFFNSIQVVCRERAIIKREHRSGLHMTAYIGAQMIYQAFICVCQSVILLAVLKVMGVHFLSTGVVTGFFIVDMFVTCFLITYSADMLALMVSCIVRDTTSAMTVMPMLLIVELVFSGVAFPLGGMAGNVANFTISKWGIYAICTTANYNTLQSSALWTALNKIGGSPQVQSVIETIRDTPGLRYKLQVWTGQQMFNSNYLYTKANVVREWGVLALMALVAAAVGVIFLEFIDHDKR